MIIDEGAKKFFSDRNILTQADELQGELSR
jgi:hypothetical protein